MKIMSYEIPIYCWQLKRPGTRAAHNFRVPLYLVTNLFWASGGCRLGWGGSLSPSVSRGGLEGSQAPEHDDPASRHPLWEGLGVSPWEDFKQRARCPLSNDVSAKTKEGLSFCSLSLCAMKRLPKKIAKTHLALRVWHWDSLKYFFPLSLTFSPSVLSSLLYFILCFKINHSLFISLSSIFLLLFSLSSSCLQPPSNKSTRLMSSLPPWTLAGAHWLLSAKQEWSSEPPPWLPDDLGWAGNKEQMQGSKSPKGIPDPWSWNFFPWPPARLPKVRNCFSFHLREFLKFQQMKGREHAENHNVTDILQNIYFLFRQLFSNHNTSYRTKVAFWPWEENPERPLNSWTWEYSGCQGRPLATSHAQKKTCGFGFGVCWDADGLRVLEASS